MKNRAKTPKDRGSRRPAGAGRLRPFEIELRPDEKWWGGKVVDGPAMPYGGRSRVRVSLHAQPLAEENQAQPLLISNRGRCVWSEGAFDFEFARGVLRLSGASGRWRIIEGGATLRDAFRAAARRFFPASGRTPAPILFTAPQYNTWIELRHDQTQEKILAYARAILANGFPPGVLMIDDNWQEDYGVWEFSSRRFPDPKGMMAELHELGFRVMLWVCPFVSPDSATYRELAEAGCLLRQAGRIRPGVWSGGKNDAALIPWWNGVSAVLDLTHPKARDWFGSRLDRLAADYGVDGFKFDGGDSSFYLPASDQARLVSHCRRRPEEHSTDYARIGLRYPLNEFRACWKLAGQPLAQRLRDKDHSWEALRELIPGAITQGLLGYAFGCPDMIGGGRAGAFEDPGRIDRELIVRSAQVHALMPMMQFSLAPWRVLEPDLAKLCLEAARLHVVHGPRFLRLAEDAARNGEPIVRPLVWEWPDQGYEEIRDQFLLGDELLVAPVLFRGARSRDVLFPPGGWTGDDGFRVEGPTRCEIAAPLDRLPFFVRAR